MIILSFDIGIKNLSYCLCEIEEHKINIIKWECVSLIDKDDKCKKYNITELTRLILHLLDSHFANNEPMMTIDHVLIENQPSNLNGLMKTLSVVIFTYFNYKQIQNSIVTGSVQFISATNKLKCKKKINATIKQKLTYTERKKLSIELTKMYLENDEDHLTWFCKQKKQDDYSDSFLYIVYYVENCI